MTGLVLQDVHKARGGRPVLTGVDLDAGGGLLALLGPSGCGKTTLLRTVGGFERANRGTIRFGETVLDGPGRFVPPERRGIGYVPQDGLLFPHLTVAGNVGFGLPRSGRKGRRVDEVLGLVGLGGIAGLAARSPHQLSGGQQQRVALARALAPHPGLVLLDEPFSGLDGPLRRALAADVAAVLRASGSAALLVTHDPDEAFAVADRVAVMHEGRIAQCADPGTLYSRPSSLAVARLTGPTVELEALFRDGAADCALGRVPLVRTGAPTGRGIVLFRPDQVVEVDERDGVAAEVVSAAFRGGHVEAVVSLGGAPLTVRLARSVPTGGRVGLRAIGPGVAFAPA